ncbi:MAG: hypothetical protein ACOVOX_12445 [Burkholderiaceae bacterium]
MRERPSFGSAAALALLFTLTLFAYFFFLQGLPQKAVLVCALCGVIGASAWFLLPRLSPAVVGFFIAFIPAFFTPDAFFSGLGFLLILACVIAGGLFSLALYAYRGLK